MEHAIAYAQEINSQKKKEPCLSFAEKTNSEICAIVKKQLEIFHEKKLLNYSNKMFLYKMVKKNDEGACK